MKDEIMSVVHEMRGFNRFYTKVLGLIDKHILDSPFSLTEARVLFEIGHNENCTANLLVEKLEIDPGYMSRILKGFEKKGLISRENSGVDGRVYILMLTPYGQSTLEYLEENSNRQIYELIKHLKQDEYEGLAEAMKYIRKTLTTNGAVTIRRFKPEETDYIIKRHMDLYLEEYGFDSTFGSYVGDAVHKFMETYDENREDIWIAEFQGEPVGSIAIVRVDDTTSQLRWFLLEPEMRGKGVGDRLMKTAVDFCKEKNYKLVYLWTLSILQAARHLYKRYGFEITETEEHDIWGKHLVEERWDLKI